MKNVNVPAPEELNRHVELVWENGVQGRDELFMPPALYRESLIKWQTKQDEITDPNKLRNNQAIKSDEAKEFLADLPSQGDFLERTFLGYAEVFWAGMSIPKKSFDEGYRMFLQGILTAQHTVDVIEELLDIQKERHAGSVDYDEVFNALATILFSSIHAFKEAVQACGYTAPASPDYRSFLGTIEPQWKNIREDNQFFLSPDSAGRSARDNVLAILWAAHTHCDPAMFDFATGELKISDVTLVTYITQKVNSLGEASHATRLIEGLRSQEYENTGIRQVGF